MKKLKILFAICTFCFIQPGNAEVIFNGFASIYGGVTSGDDEFLYDYDDEIRFKPESKFGLQARADLTDGLSATAQILARGRNDFEAEFEWAYVTYSVSEYMDISAGRLRAPLFKYSEYLDVGYAFPWIRTPRDVYAIEFNTMEGIRFNYNDTYGDWDASWQLVYGGLNQTLVFSGSPLETDFSNILGLSLDLTYDWASFRLGYTQADSTINAGLDAISALFPDVNDFNDIQAKDDYGYFLSGGVFIDYDGWLLNFEMVEYTIEDSLNNKDNNFYFMLGRRFDDFTLAYTYSEIDGTNDFSAADGVIDVGTLDPSCPVATTADYIRFCVIEPESQSETHAITLRWDFHPAAAFKLEYIMNEFEQQSIVDTMTESNLLTVGVDLIF